MNGHPHFCPSYLTILTGVDSLVKIQPTKLIRIIGIALLTLLWLSISLSLTSKAINTLYDALSGMLYLLVPWTAVNLTDYFFVRKGRYAIADFFSPSGIYGAWGWRGIAAYIIGFIASIPFFNLAGMYEGPIAHALGGVDISWAPGLLVAALAYIIFSRNINFAKEREAMSVSVLTLEAAHLTD